MVYNYNVLTDTPESEDIKVEVTELQACQSQVEGDILHSHTT